MATATLTSKGQLTLPKIVRDELGLSTGATVDFVRTAEGYQLVAINHDIASLKGMFAGRVKRAVSPEDMDSAIQRSATLKHARSKS
jgi:antitoxin PrlF